MFDKFIVYQCDLVILHDTEFHIKNKGIIVKKEKM